MKDATIRAYTRDDHHHDIVILGVTHIGTPEYYDDLQAKIDTLETFNYTVHHEGVRIPEDLNGLTQQETDWLHRLQEADAYTSLARPLGLVTQKESLLYPPSWSNHDLTMAEMLKLIDDPETIVRQFEEMDDVGRQLLEAKETTVGRVILRLLRKIIMARAALWLGARSKQNRTAHRRREQVASVAAASEPRDVVMVWGKAHLGGFHERFQALGYRRDRVLEANLKIDL